MPDKDGKLVLDDGQGNTIKVYPSSGVVGDQIMVQFNSTQNELNLLLDTKSATKLTRAINASVKETKK